MAVTYIASRSITIHGHLYQAGDAVDTTGWDQNVISEYIRMGWLDAATNLTSGAEIASSVLANGFTPTNNTQQDVTGWSLIVPANSGPANITVVGGVLVSITTGTNASTVAQRLSLYIVDEANTVWGLGQWSVFGTGTSQTPANTLPLGAAVPNAGTDKTYRVQIQVSRLGTSSATGSISAGGGIFPNATLQAIHR